MKKIILSGLVLLACFFTVCAQTLPTNFSNLKASSITDNQLNQIVQQMTAAGYQPGQFFELAVARGMNPSEATLVQERINKKSNSMNMGGGVGDSTGRNTNSYNRYYNNDTLSLDSTKYREKEDSLNLKEKSKALQVFGSEIFSNNNLTFEPNLRIATPVNYIIGPDDEIMVLISGYQEYSNRFKVSPDGFISIPNVGVVYVAGLTFEEASKRIKDKLAANGYSNIRTGLTKVNITLGSIRSIHVTLIGEVKKPGSYTLPSLATVFNALYASGGPNERGSFRNIEIIRSNTVIDTLDVYDFLTKGDLRSNILLADQDIIRIPVYKKRVTLKGAFKRPGIFEVANGEKLQEVLTYAGGFNDSAAASSISAVQVAGDRRRIEDIPESEYATFVPQNADVYTVDTIQDRFENRVQVTGAVFAPGNYAWRPGLTLRELLQDKAKGVKEEAYLKQGFIRRLQSDYLPVAVDFNVADVLAGRSNVLLQKEDVVTILSNFELREYFDVTIDGAVAKPGKIPFIDSLTLQDAILQAGGLTIGADNKIEISRRIKNADPHDKNAPISQTIEVVYDSLFFSGNSNMWLQPYDRILVKTNPSFVLPQQAYINGEVLYPGAYTLQTKTEKTTSLINRSGGLRPTANAGSAYLLRLRDNATEAERRRHLEAITSNDKQVYITNDMLTAYDKFILDLDYLRAHPGSVQDVVLKPGDVLVINPLNNTVKVSGQVYNPSISVYEKGKSMEYYIDRAGGYAPNSKKKNTLVLYPNGEAKKVSRFLFFKSSPNIEPGAEVIVPREQDRERHRLTTSEVVAITGSVASLAAVVLAVLNYVK